MPDYSQCSLSELISIAAHINQEKYPDRYAAVRDEIERRGQEPLSQFELNAARGGFLGCGLFLGPFLYTITIYLVHLIFIPSILGDGQYGMIIFWTVPAGAVLGALFGALLPSALKSPLLTSSSFWAAMAVSFLIVGLAASTSLSFAAMLPFFVLPLMLLLVLGFLIGLPRLTNR
ncbi:MAG: hypothetical protein KY445_07285 [Armatimonadetes bacterium]|nr:hypothetical protein [Armatimonadota bacterium]